MGIDSRALKGKGPSVDGIKQGMGRDAVGTGTEVLLFVEQRVLSLHPSLCSLRTGNVQYSQLAPVKV